jgi:hypothetical protein
MNPSYRTDELATAAPPPPEEARCGAHFKVGAIVHGEQGSWAKTEPLSPGHPAQWVRGTRHSGSGMRAVPDFRDAGPVGEP